MKEAYSVNVTFTGVFSICYRGSVVSAPPGKDTYSWQLLKYLLANPDRWISQEELLQEIWPADQYSDDPCGTLRVRLRRTRELLNRLGLGDSLTGLILYSKDRYRISPSYMINSDIGRAIQSCRLLQQKTLPDEAAVIFCKEGLSAFHGEYLENTRKAPWVERGRENCRSCFYLLAQKALELARKSNTPELAVLLSEKLPLFLPEEHPVSSELMAYLIEAGCIAETLTFYSELTKACDRLQLALPSLSPFLSRSMTHEEES